MKTTLFLKNSVYMHCMKKGKKIKMKNKNRRIITFEYTINIWQWKLAGKKKKNAVLNKYTLQLYHALSEPPFVVDKYK